MILKRKGIKFQRKEFYVLNLQHNIRYRMKINQKILNNTIYARH